MVTSTTYDGAAPVAAGRRPASIDAGDRGALLALAVRLRSDALDRELVAGTDPLSTGSLRLRARQLVGRRSRRSLSAGLSRTRRAAESASWELTAAVPPNRAEVLAARPVLAEVERRLRAAGPISARGGDAAPAAVRGRRPAVPAVCRRGAHPAAGGDLAGARADRPRAARRRRREPGRGSVTPASRPQAGAIAEPERRPVAPGPAARRPGGRPGLRRSFNEAAPQARALAGRAGAARATAEALGRSERRPPTTIATSSPTPAGGPGPRRAGDRLRRHRDEPALHRAGRSSPPTLRPPPTTRPGSTGRLADLLVADDRGLDQVRRLHHAGPQPRRRRDHGADRADPAPQGRPRRGDADRRWASSAPACSSATA